MHDRLTADVETCVNQQGAAGATLEGAENGVEAGGAVRADRLHPG